MDCQHIQQNEFHEKYLLGQLSQSEKNDYEEHIEVCSSCLEDLAKQKTMIAGIQAVGREQMRQQIKKQVSQLRNQQRSEGSKWQMILKIAAVLFMVALIPSAAYYFRTDSGEPVARLVIPEKSLPEKAARDIEEKKDKIQSTKGEERPPFPSSEVASEEATKESGEQTADVDLERDQQTDAPSRVNFGLPDDQIDEIASGGAGQGYGSARIDSNQKISVSITEESAGTPPGLAPSITKTAEIQKEELQSALSKGTRYQFTESEAMKEIAPQYKSQETTLQEYDALRSKKLARDYRTKGKGVMDEEIRGIPTAVFKSGVTTISVDFVPSNRELTLDKKSNLPRSFEVVIFDRDSLNWEMIWLVGNEFTQYDPSQMELVIEDKTIYVIILKNYVYKIDTNADTTKAVLVKNNF